MEKKKKRVGIVKYNKSLRKHWNFNTKTWVLFQYRTFDEAEKMLFSGKSKFFIHIF